VVAAVKATILVGDVLERLRDLPDESVQCVVTSPPYWGLRDYGTATWEGGAPGCAHMVGGQVQDTKAPGAITTGQRPGVDASACRKCGARRIDAQIGLEPTPEAYVEKMVAVFREVRRVLRDDGTLWLNLGDSYSSGGRKTQVAPTLRTKGHDDASGKAAYLSGFAVRPGAVEGLAGKQLIGIPWRVAFALQADGWYLRSDIIWSKPNPMPESVTDRPTKAHEYLFLLSKSPRYYFDQEAVREAGAGRLDRGATGSEGRIGAQGWSGEPLEAAAGRNIRTVWTIATAPFPDAHFATFPPALVEPCVKAGSRQDGIVLDPFAGSGTTGVVALSLGRSFIGIELNPTYAEMAERRLYGVAPLLAQVEVAHP